jgi:hypothetical protein
MGQDLLMESTQPIETGAYARRRVRVNRLGRTPREPRGDR